MADEKKLIIDEDWKEEAQREKEALARAMEAERQPKARTVPASFGTLVSGLASQALAALGELPDPFTGKVELRLEEAKFHIDLLEVLQEKTQGNLSPSERQMLESLLFDLRLRFVDRQKAAPATA